MVYSEIIKKIFSWAPFIIIGYFLVLFWKSGAGKTLQTILDSLLSTVQMPSGVPVGTLAIGKAGSINAALLAIAILSTRYNNINNKLNIYRKNFEKKVPKKPY